MLFRSHMSVGKQVEQREIRIQELEQDVERYRVELEQKPLLPASQPDGGDEAYVS